MNLRIFSLGAAFCVVLGGCAPASERAAPADCPAGPDAATLAPGDGRRVALAAAPGGDGALAAWESTTAGPLRAASAAGGRWAAATALSEAGATAPSPVVTAAGGQAVAWDGYVGDDRAVRFARRGPDGRWEPPRTVGRPSGVRPRRPSLAAAPSGGLLLAWRGDPDGAILAATAPPGGAFGDPVAVLGEGDVRDVVAVVDAGGRRTIAWIENRPGGAVVRAATAAGEGWSTPVLLSEPGVGTADLRAAAGPGGHLALAWRAELPDRRDRLELRVRRPDGAWRPRRTVGTVHGRPLGLPRPPGPADLAPALAVDGDGSAVVAWPQRDGRTERVLVARVSAAGIPGAPRPLSASDGAGGPSLAVGGDGTVAAAWEDLEGARLSVRIAFMRPGGDTWSGCRTLGPPRREIASPRIAWPRGAGPVVAWGSTGDAAVLAARTAAP